MRSDKVLRLVLFLVLRLVVAGAGPERGGRLSTYLTGGLRCHKCAVIVVG